MVDSLRCFAPLFGLSVIVDQVTILSCVSLSLPPIESVFYTRAQTIARTAKYTHSRCLKRRTNERTYLRAAEETFLDAFSFPVV